MGKLDELRRSALGNIDESMGSGVSASGGHTPRITPGSSTIPARLQGVIRSNNAVEIPTGKIGPDPDQPRDEFDEDSLNRLADSMKGRGQLQPIRVRWDEVRNVYVIVCGERRWRAAGLAGLPTMTAIIQDGAVSPAELLAMQLIENAVREDLKPVEQAKAFRALMNLNGWSGNQLAKELGIAQPNVVRTLALLDLPTAVQMQVEQGGIAPATAYEIGKLDDPSEQSALAERVMAEGLTRAETAQVVKAAAPPDRAKGRGPTSKAKGKPKKTEFVFRTAVGPRITVEFKRGLDDTLTLSALREAASQIEARLSDGEQSAA